MAILLANAKPKSRSLASFITLTITTLFQKASTNNASYKIDTPNNVLPAKNEVEYVVEIINKKGEKRIISFKDEKTNFGDFVLPYNFIVKKEGSLDVTVKRYSKVDSVVTLKDTLLTLKYENQ